MYELALFAGAGGGILGGMLCGHTCVGAVEIEEFPRKVLMQRQRDGLLPAFPIWDDVCTFSIENPECREYIEKLREMGPRLIISGGFPCQDISSAGKGAGIEGERSGLWKEMARIVREIRPDFVFVENSPMLVRRGLAVVAGDFASMGYDCRWGVIGADDSGAPHRRKRIWILAHSAIQGGPQRGSEQQCRPRDAIWPLHRGEISAHVADSAVLRTGETRNFKTARKKSGNTQSYCRANHSLDLSNTENKRVLWRKRSKGQSGQQSKPDGSGKEVDECRQWWAAEPGLGRVANGVADRVDRLKAIGNGQVPDVVEIAQAVLI